MGGSGVAGGSGCSQPGDCPGICQTCSNGSCVAVKDADDTDSCAGTCDSTGLCKSKKGQQCSTTQGGCVSGSTCAPDGYCCDKPCTESCMACDIQGLQGTCTAVTSGDPHSNHAACGTDAQCKGTCSGRSDGACAFSSPTCSGPPCSGTSMVQQSVCTSGACVPSQLKDCDGGYVCAPNACKNSCTSDSDCRADYFCGNGTCHLDALSVAVAPNGDHYCVVLADHTVRCWGRNGSGQLGSGAASSGWVSQPITVAGLQNVTALAIGNQFSCALLADATVRCWGANNDQSRGSAGTIALTPTTPSGGISGVVGISAGQGHVCTVDTGGTVKCWGDNSKLQLGYATSGSYYTTPRPVAGLGAAKAVAAGSFHTCALLTNGTPYCWGWGAEGELGSNSAGDTPQPVDTVGSGASGISCGASHSCLLKDGHVTCWGWNGSGEIGIGSSSGAGVPPTLVPGLSNVSAISARDSATCAFLAGGGVSCWGVVMSSVFDTPDQASMSPQAVSLPSASSVSAGYRSCAVLANGSVVCWGWDTIASPPLRTATPTLIPGW